MHTHPHTGTSAHHFKHSDKTVTLGTRKSPEDAWELHVYLRCQKNALIQFETPKHLSPL